MNNNPQDRKPDEAANNAGQVSKTQPSAEEQKNNIPAFLPNILIIFGVIDLMAGILPVAAFWALVAGIAMKIRRRYLRWRQLHRRPGRVGTVRSG